MAGWEAGPIGCVAWSRAARAGAPAGGTAFYRLIRSSEPPVLALGGELDLVAVTELECALLSEVVQLAADGRGSVAVSLREVGFLDCCGLGMLCRLRGRVLGLGCEFRMLAVGRQPRRVIVKLGLSAMLGLPPPLSASGGVIRGQDRTGRQDPSGAVP